MLCAKRKDTTKLESAAPVFALPVVVVVVVVVGEPLPVDKVVVGGSVVVVVTKKSVRVVIQGKQEAYLGSSS